MLVCNVLQPYSTRVHVHVRVQLYNALYTYCIRVVYICELLEAHTVDLITKRLTVHVGPLTYNRYSYFRTTLYSSRKNVARGNTEYALTLVLHNLHLL